MSTDTASRRDRLRRDEPDTIANFPRRLKRVVMEAAPPDTQVDLYPIEPGGVWKLGLRVVSPGFDGVGRTERESPFWRAILDHLWDEQGRVGELIALTPEEDAPPAATTGGGE